MAKPNFFIVGAPKCGTTSLYTYLRDHPEIFMSRIKEPQFFADDSPRIWYTSTLQLYLALFDEAEPGHRAVGEGSTAYLSSETAIKNIYDFDPRARIIVCLRNPVDMVYSWHGQLLYEFLETETDFEKAWDLQPLRKKGEHIPLRCDWPFSLQYREMADFPKHLNRVFSIFPASQVKIVLFDDMKVDPRGTYLEVLDFLGLPDDGRVDFPVANPSKHWHWPWLGRLLVRPPAFLKKSVEIFKRTTGVKDIPFKNKIRSTNRKEIKRDPLSEQMRKRLTDVFAEDIDQLSVLIGRDLSHWKQ